VAKLSCEAATEENAKRRSFMPRTQVTGKANFSPGITSGLLVIRSEAVASSKWSFQLPTSQFREIQFYKMSVIRE